MGGKAFASLGLFMPRMPPDIYQKVLSRVQTQLRTLYAQAETPIEGPAKLDYGDIDVLVIAKQNADQPNAELIAGLLGAKHFTKTPKSSTTHFALPWPEEEDNANDSDRSRKVGSLQDSKYDGSQLRFIQVDVNVGLTVEIFRYTLFQHAHGDMWVILGAILRRFGFINGPTGFYICIPELDGLNKNLVRFKLTDQPNTVLRYLGMDEQRFWSKFESWNEAMDYVSTCRFHDPRRGEHHDNEDMLFKFDLKAHDRSKYSKRPMFRYWLDTYLPEHRGDRVGQASHLSKEEVVDDMKKFFGKQAAIEFDTKRKSGVHISGVEKLWSGVRQTSPCTGSDLTHIMKGLKFEVMEMEARAEDEDFKNVQKAFADGNFDVVKIWANTHWKEVLEREKQRDHAKSTTKLLEHLKKENAGPASSLESKDKTD